MAVRKDSVQIDITFITDENRQLAKLNQGNKGMLKDLRQIKKEGGDVAEVVQRIAREGEKVANIDLTRVAPAELIARAKTLGAVLRQIPESAPGYAKLNDEYKRINTRLAEIRKNSRGVIQESTKMGSVLQKAFAVFGGITLAGIGQGILNIGRNMISASTNAQKFEAVLTNALGSKSEAQKALRGLQEFSSTTNFQLDELTEGFIKLVNRGIIPTQDEMVQLGDLANSQGKTYDQLVEAVLDARTAEFERLKEFGIRAKKDGDIIQLSFKGITKEVANTEEAITQAILDFGKLEGVVGSTASIAQTRGGLISNFFDNLGRILTNLGNGPIGRAFDGVLTRINNLSKRLVEFTSTNDKATESFKQQAKQVAGLERDFVPLLDRYDELMMQGQLNEKEQEELNNIIQQVAATVPSAVTEFDKYGNALNINTSKAREFVRVQQLMLQERNREAIEEQQEKLGDLQNEYDALSRVVMNTDGAFAEVVKRGGEYFRRVEVGGKNTRIELRKLGEEEVAKLISRFGDLQERIEGTQAEINSLSGKPIVDLLNEETQEVEKKTLSGGGNGADLGEKGLETRLKGIDAFFKRQQLLLDRSLLQREISESDHGKRMLQLQVEQYNQQLEAYELYNEAQSLEAEEARNKLLEIQQQLQRNPQVVQGLGAPATPDGVERRGIDEGLEQISEFEEARLSLLRNSFEAALIAENEYVVAKLELRRSTLQQEIELLRMGTDEEVKEAARKAEQLIEVDEELAERRKQITKSEADARKTIEEAAKGFFKDSIEFGIALLAKDEEARKKNINVIKAFQSGQIIANGITEVQKIYQKYAGVPGGQLIALFEVLGATARTATALTKIRGTKFSAARGISLGTFGGRLHSEGGTTGVFSDGTTIEVERDEKFVVLNRRASGMLGALSDLNVATGGRSLLTASDSYRYNTGGLIATNTTPTSSTAPLGGSSSVDISPLLIEFRMLRESFRLFPTRLKADVVYTDVEAAANDVYAVRENSSV